MEKINDDYIINNCCKSSGGFSPLSLKNLNVALYLKTRYNDIPENLFSYKEVFYRIKNNIDIRPVCSCCGNPVKFTNHYTLFCSRNCTGLHNSENMKYIWTNRTDDDKQILQEKSKLTCLKHFGVEYSFLSDNNKKKSDLTREQKYGDKNYGKFGSTSFKNKMKEKYGYEHPLSNEIVREKISTALSSTESQNKMRKTCKERYNVEYVSQLLETLIKVNETYKKHKTFKSSKDEELLYTILIDIFGVDNIIRSFNSELYPYNCDFYIKSLDLYIEYQGSMFHNKHLFNYKIDKQELYNLMKKTSITDKPNRYNNLIDTWTVRDINKWDISKINKLNMLFIYPFFHKDWMYYKTHENKYEIYNSIKDYIKNIIYNNYKENVNNLQLKIGENI